MLGYWSGRHMLQTFCRGSRLCPGKLFTSWYRHQSRLLPAQVRSAPGGGGHLLGCCIPGSADVQRLPPANGAGSAAGGAGLLPPGDAPVLPAQPAAGHHHGQGTGPAPAPSQVRPAQLSTCRMSQRSLVTCGCAARAGLHTLHAGWGWERFFNAGQNHNVKVKHLRIAIWMCKMLHAQ